MKIFLIILALSLTYINNANAFYFVQHNLEMRQHRLFYDTFTDSNGTGLEEHTPDYIWNSAAWDEKLAATRPWSINSNSASVGSSGAGTQDNFACVTVGAADVVLEFDMYIPSTLYGGMATNRQDGDNIWQGYLIGSTTDKIGIEERIGASGVERASSAYNPASDTFHMRMARVGSTIRLDLNNNTVVATYALATTLNNETEHCIGIRSTADLSTVTYDNVTITTP